MQRTFKLIAIKTSKSILISSLSTGGLLGQDPAGCWIHCSKTQAGKDLGRLQNAPGPQFFFCDKMFTLSTTHLGNGAWLMRAAAAEQPWSTKVMKYPAATSSAKGPSQGCGCSLVNLFKSIVKSCCSAPKQDSLQQRWLENITATYHHFAAAGSIPSCGAAACATFGGNAFPHHWLLESLYL